MMKFEVGDIVQHVHEDCKFEKVGTARIAALARSINCEEPNDSA